MFVRSRIVCRVLQTSFEIEEESSIQMHLAVRIRTSGSAALKLWQLVQICDEQDATNMRDLAGRFLAAVS